MSAARHVVDRTTYREPAPFVVFDDSAPPLDDILLRTGPLPAFHRGVLREAPHIALDTAGPLTYRAAMEYDCQRLARLTPRDWQLDVPELLHSGRDVLVQATTGAGKSLPFVLPVLADLSKFVIIASPLNILESGMASAYAQMGLTCLVYNAENRSKEQALALRKREFHVLITSPENLTKYGALRPLLSDPDWSCACALLGIDEAHLIVDWGLENFRPEYAKLGQIRSYFDAPILAVSATLPPAAVSSLAGLLHLSPHYEFVNLGNVRSNLFWEVREIGGAVLGLESLRFLVPETLTTPETIPQTIVFVQSRPLAHRVANRIRSFLPETRRHSDVVMSLHALMRPRHKQRVIASFDSGATRIMVSTSIAALGRDFGSVTRIVAFHLPGNLEAWVQEAGRGARRAGMTCHALLLVQSSAYKIKSGVVSRADPESDTSDSDFEPAGASTRNSSSQYPDDATADMFSKYLQPAWRSFVAPLSSFSESSPCRCEIHFRYFDNPGVLKLGLCDVCRARGVSSDIPYPDRIDDLTVPAGSRAVPAETPALLRRAAPKRRGDDLATARQRLGDWRLKVFRAEMLVSGYTLDALMSDSVLDAIASSLKLFHVSDLDAVSPPWPLRTKYGRQVLDIMHQLQSDEAAAKAERQRKAAEKREADAAAAVAAKAALEEKLRRARAIHSSNNDIRRSMPRLKPEPVAGAIGTRARVAAGSSLQPFLPPLPSLPTTPSASSLAQVAVPPPPPWLFPQLPLPHAAAPHTPVARGKGKRKHASPASGEPGPSSLVDRTNSPPKQPSKRPKRELEGRALFATSNARTGTQQVPGLLPPVRLQPGRVTRSVTRRDSATEK